MTTFQRLSLALQVCVVGFLIELASFWFSVGETTWYAVGAALLASLWIGFIVYNNRGSFVEIWTCVKARAGWPLRIFLFVALAISILIFSNSMLLLFFASTLILVCARVFFCQSGDWDKSSRGENEAQQEANNLYWDSLDFRAWRRRKTSPTARQHFRERMQ